MSSGIVALDPQAADHPMAVLISDLVRQNVDGNPRRTAVLTALEFTAVIVATDLDSSVRLEFRGLEGLLVGDGGADTESNKAMVTISAPSDTVLELARLQLIGDSGVPVLWNPTGFAVLKKFLSGELSIRPLLRYLGKLLKLLTVISVNSAGDQAG